MKSFDPKPWLLPQPVLILGTFDAEGKPNAMNVAWAGMWNDMRKCQQNQGQQRKKSH